MSTREELEKRRSSLPAAKQFLLEKRKQKIASLGERADVIAQRPLGVPVPASFAQQRFWFLHQLQPDNTAYNEVRTFRAPMQLDSDVLKRALLEVMRRHEILRTTFSFKDGKLQQLVHAYEEASAAFSLQEIDLRQTPAAEREQEAQRVIRETVTRPFDLAQGPLWRNTVIRMGEADTILVNVIHHILCDGWGLDIFEQELHALYMAFQMGQPSPLPEPELQYADFAYWEHQRAQGDHWKQQINYWKQTLSDVNDQPLLYGDYPRQSIQNAPRASLAFSIPASVAQELREASSREGVTLFMILLATFQLLLFQYSGQNDITIGTPISRRSKSELGSLMGCFINMLVLRTDFSGDPTFQALLQRVRTTALGAYANQDIPFEQLVADLAPERNKNRNPFFQVMLDFQNYQQVSLTPSESTTTARNIAADISQFDLVVRLWDSGTELPGEIFYPSSLFDASTVEDMRDQFLLLLAHVAKNAAQPIAAIDTLTARERQTLARWAAARTQSELDAIDQQDLEERDETEPRTPLEEILVEIWTQILGLEWVGIHDNFFRIGGHSLLATQLLAQIQNVLDIDIPLQLVFDAPTVATFAEELLKDEHIRERVERTIELLFSVADLSEDEAAAMLVES